MSSSGIAVIGGGIAAQALCEEVRARDPEVGLTMICAESCLPYDRVRLSEILVSGEESEALALRPEEWYEDNAVETLLGRRVERIDAAFGRLTLDGGEALSIDRLVLATGSQPLMPPLPGLDLPGVIPFRDPGDCDAIRAAAAAGARVAVIGGGLLGLEAAYGIAAQGARVTVVHLMERLMERQLDDEAAAMLLPAIEALGVEVLLGRQTERVLGRERAEGLRFAGGEEIPADLVVVSIGIRPEAALAAEAGIETGRGIVVDDGMRTSAPGVWAVGECAEHRGMVYGLVAPIREQAAVAADSLLGDEQATYEGSLQWAKLKVMGVDLVSIGLPEGAQAAAVADAASPSYRKLVLSEGRAVGAILLGDTRGSEDLLAAIAAGEEVADPLERLAASAETSAIDLPDAAQICNCNGVCKGDIVGAVTEGGCATAREVMATTRAGTGCGSCKATVVELVSAATGGAAEEPVYLCPCRRQTREELAAVIRERGFEAVSQVADACGTGRDCGQCKPGLAYLVSEVNANRHREERAARFINDRVHANIQNDGTFSVVPRMYGGVTTPDELRRIADAAERYEVRMVKVTGGQRIDLLGVKKDDLPAVWADLNAAGMVSGHAYAKGLRTVKTCVGSEWCRFGTQDSTGLGVQLEKIMWGSWSPAKVKLAVSGCPRNCAEATCKDIGVICVDSGYEIHIGGAAGLHIQGTQVLTKVATEEEAIWTICAVMQLYRENAWYLERIYKWMARIGLESIRAEIENPERRRQLYDLFAYSQRFSRIDPWAERVAGRHAEEFNPLSRRMEFA
jgi:nitrite reductase (NADH) large subunit